VDQGSASTRLPHDCTTVGFFRSLLRFSQSTNRVNTKPNRSHPGRQSPLGAGNRSVFTKTLAPSAIPLNLGDNWIAFLARVVVFGTPAAMTTRQIDEVIAQFTRAASLAARSGFSGVEIQAARTV
jgi:hypothetical protein